ncbi:MAG: TrkA family potassium uptake protein [Clostridia bacterium]|nr:TrkA family potassium uptake protein [Clostridia bacterium]MBP5755427.1 TrkA family potassium uptake protein [Clostridia bacterium]
MKSILLIGLGRFGLHIAIQLNQLGHQVMAVDKNEARVNDAIDIVTNAQIGDSTNMMFLRSLGIDNYDVCIVTIGGNFQSSLETTYALKELGAKYVVSRAEQDGQAEFLLRNGANEVLYPEKQVAKWAAIRYSSDHILDYIELDETHSIFEVEVPKEWDGLSIGQLDVRRKYNINIVAVKQNNTLSLSVTPETTLTKDQTMLVLGEYKALRKCFHI